MTMQNGSQRPAERRDLVRRHLLLGWAALLVFLAMGMALEVMHGFKVGFLLDVDNATRRLMWTLSHAHGSLLGLVNIAYALTLRAVPEEIARPDPASLCLFGATVLLPGGFFLGGLVIYSGDPGFGVLLTPLGGLLFLVAVGHTLWQLFRRS